MIYFLVLYSKKINAIKPLASFIFSSLLTGGRLYLFCWIERWVEESVFVRNNVIDRLFPLNASALFCLILPAVSFSICNYLLFYFYYNAYIQHFTKCDICVVCGFPRWDTSVACSYYVYVKFINTFASENKKRIDSTDDNR